MSIKIVVIYIDIINTLTYKIKKDHLKYILI